MPNTYNNNQNLISGNQTDFNISVNAGTVENVNLDSSNNVYNMNNNEGNGEQHMYQQNDMNNNSINNKVMNNSMNGNTMNNGMNNNVVNANTMNNMGNNAMNGNGMNRMPDKHVHVKKSFVGAWMKVVAVIIATIALAGSAIISWTQTKVAEYDDYGSQIIGYAPDWPQFIFYFGVYFAACVLLCGFLFGMGEIICLLQKIVNKQNQE